ncbi:hypothetical protein AKJ66_02520 [candidate division MSBL1 archaeon SCGC-AAA259E22]|uniref:Uncharacterized protein n=1 Tax=candidate division MSBL1 archaeon SCGC-AAA259E22 TaxID=1698265 RepID=A0A133UGB2_9EURY|nr:hypothetical protein AKJ66_02520 [candidate division MSBL1 archaeon SCGC-AAA259E22]
MPNREDHVRHCEKLYGYSFEEIHKWMDGTVKSRGPTHRVDRHDIKRTPDKAFGIFKDKVPEKYREYIKDAVKDHIELDERKNKVKRVSSEKELFAKEDWTIEDTRKFERKEIKKVRGRKDKYERWEREMLKGTDIPRVSTSEEIIQEKRCYLLGKMAECIDKWIRVGSKNLISLSVKSYDPLTGEKMDLGDIANEFRRNHNKLKKILEKDEDKRMSDQSFLDAKWKFAILLQTAFSFNDWKYVNGEMIKKIDRQKKKSKCFIATASLGSPSHPQLDYLREFRDDKLLTSSIGRAVVHIYYRLSPTIANIISRSSSLRKMGRRLIIGPMIQAVR